MSLDLCGFPGGKIRRQGIYTFTPKNAVLLRNPGVRKALAEGVEDMAAKVIRADGSVCDLALKCAGLTADERLILQEGCLMNYYAAGYGKD